MERTPQSLLERLRHNPDAASWKRLVDLYRPLLESFFRHGSVPGSDVDDLIQEVLAVVVRELPAFQHNSQRGAFRRWLRTIAQYRMKNYWRGRRSGVQPIPGEQAVKLLEQVEDPASDLDRRWDQEHDQLLIRRALELLEPEFRRTPS